jgi:hypothetical protein
VRWSNALNPLQAAAEGHVVSRAVGANGVSMDQSDFTLTGNRNRSSIFAFVAFSDGKSDSTCPENAFSS